MHVFGHCDLGYRTKMYSYLPNAKGVSQDSNACFADQLSNRLD